MWSTNRCRHQDRLVMNKSGGLKIKKFDESLPFIRSVAAVRV
jgi:hypothetical protein